MRHPTHFGLWFFTAISYLWLLTDDDNDNYCSFVFADTQVVISTSFLFGTIPFMKTIERMTNPYFQDIDFAKVLKGKHVRHDPDEPDNELEDLERFSSQEVGNDGGSDREEIDKNHSLRVNPLTIQPSLDLIEEG